MPMPTQTVDDSEEKEQVNPGVLSWVEEIRRVSLAVSNKPGKVFASRNQVFFLLHWTADASGFGVTVLKGRSPESSEEWWAIDRALDKPPPFVAEEDIAIFRLLWAERRHDSGLRAFGLGPKRGGEILLKMAQTGRLYPANDFSPLRLGEQRPASIDWRLDVNGRQRPCIKPTSAGSLVVPTQPPWYVDLDDYLVGPLAVSGNPAVIERLFSLPPLSASEVALVAEALTELAPELPIPTENASARLRRIETSPMGILRLHTLNTHGNRGWRGYPLSYDSGVFDAALPVFRYQDAELKPNDVLEFTTLPDGETVCVLRQTEREQELLSALTATGMQKIPGYALHTFGSPPDHA